MGNIYNKSRPIIWPSYEQAESSPYPPYIDAENDIPSNYEYWCEIITILNYDEYRGYRYRARAYFSHSKYKDAPLKWIDFEPASNIRIHYDPTKLWRYDIKSSSDLPSHIDKPRPEIDSNNIFRLQLRNKLLLGSKRKARDEQNIKFSKVRQTADEEAEVARTHRKAAEATATLQQLGDAQLTPLPLEVVEERINRAETILENAATQEDVDQVIGLVGINQLYPIENPTSEQEARRLEEVEDAGQNILSLAAHKQILLVQEAIEILNAREKELPNSPLRDWEEDLKRLASSHDKLLLLGGAPDEAALYQLKRYRKKVSQLKKQKDSISSRPRSSDRMLPLTRTDPGIGSEERGLISSSNGK